jgi:transcriptional regulator GlxA family with amidase domain
LAAIADVDAATVRLYIQFVVTPQEQGVAASGAVAGIAAANLDVSDEADVENIINVDAETARAMGERDAAVASGETYALCPHLTLLPVHIAQTQHPRSATWKRRFSRDGRGHHWREGQRAGQGQGQEHGDGAQIELTRHMA